MPFSFDALSGLIPSDPLSIARFVVLSGAFVLVFLLLFTLRDILLRTRSFWYQCFCVLLVGALPIVGFLLYLLIRPARTIKQRETEAMLRQIFTVEDGEELDSFEEEVDDMTLPEDEAEEDLMALSDDDTPPSV
jgi:hypothetical protein